MAKITGIVSVGPKLEIGAGGRLLYPNKSDMAFFCGYTQGKLLVMGRKTAETVLSSLPGRDVLVVSRTPEVAKKASPCVGGAWDGADFERLLRIARGREIVVVGGSEIYSMFAGRYDEFFVTINTTPYNDAYGAADAFFDESCLHGLDTMTKIFEDRQNMFHICKYHKGKTLL
jgi:dihydrofolate reductase